jgi:23S rRNA-/tRNA-specific pseudouridylate synthase
MTPEEMVSRLLYRDGLMLVIDKPAGFAVHRGPKGGESLEDHFDALRFGLPRAPALAHRLDRDTSGCLVLGRHRKALAQLGKLFKNGAIDKTYWAVVEGTPPNAEGTRQKRALHLARTRAGDRAHASAPRPLRGNGLADCRRHDLWQRPTRRRPRAASACARSRGAALQEPPADPGCRANP